MEIKMKGSFLSEKTLHLKEELASGAWGDGKFSLCRTLPESSLLVTLTDKNGKSKTLMISSKDYTRAMLEAMEAKV